MLIRPVAARDVHAIAALQVRAWRAEYDGFVDEAHMPTLDDRIGLWNGVRPGEAWLAEREGRSSASSAWPTARSASCMSIPTPATRAVDDLLLTHAEAILRDAGHTTALLWTFRENAHNRALYERHGWALDGAEQETLPGVCEIRYRLVL